MDEYIKRKDAFEILQSRLDSISQMSYLNMDWHELDIMRNAIENAIDDIGEVPATDVKPVKYSSWEYRTYPIVDRDGVARRCMRGYVCKACGHGEPEEKRFCGSCGAEMRNE